MISAQEALSKCTDPMGLQRMLLIADQKIRQAIAEKASSCCILFPKHLYKEVDIRNFGKEIFKKGYIYSVEDANNSYCLLLRW